MFTLTSSHQFKKDFKRAQRKPRFHLTKLDTVLSQLQKRISLEPKYLLHKLVGEFTGCYECHIQPDVLLIFEVDMTINAIYLLRLGSHSDLF